MSESKSERRWPQRPSTAQGNLQSHPCYQSSLLDDGHAPGTIDEWKKLLNSSRPQIRMANINRDAEDYDQNLETKSYFQSFKNLRRLTVSNPNNIQQYEVILLKRAKNYALVGLKGELKPRLDELTSRRVTKQSEDEQSTETDNEKTLPLEESLSINMLDTIKRAFLQEQNEYDVDFDEFGKMNLERFTRVLKKCLGPRREIEEQIENLFNKIDYNAEESISWDELCTYLQLNFDERADAEHRAKEISFIIPAKIHENPHRYPCSTIVLSADHQYLALGSDGTISIWTSNADLKVTKSIGSTSGIDQTLTARERLEKRKDQQTRSQPKWITDCQIMPEFNKVVVSTGDRELQFWDQNFCLSTTREVQQNELPCIQISSLDSAPIKLNYGIQNKEELILVFGDTDGCVNIIIFLAARDTFRVLTTAERRKGIPTIKFDHFLDTHKCDYIRWKVHREWIEHIYFDARLNQIVSCSNDQQTAVIIGCIRASASAEYEKAENPIPKETKTSRTKSAGPRILSTRRRNTTSSDQNEENPVSTINSARHKRDSATSYVTQSSSQETHSKKPGGRESRIEGTTTALGAPRPAFVRQHPIVRTAQIRADTDQTVFKIHKGAKTFDLCTDRNVLVTGGMDRIVRIWNPYLPARPIARLRGHNSPIFLVKIAFNDDRIFSISSDKSVMVWDLTEHTLLACIRPKVHKITGDLHAVCYNPHTRSLLFAGEKISSLSLKLRPYLHADVVVSHYEPITCLLYIKEFKQIISSTESGVIRLWDFVTGRQIHEFRSHNGQAVTSMVLDENERRLITGSRDGTCCVWNVHNGQLLRILKKPRDDSEVTDVCFIVLNNNGSVLSVGWDKYINVFKDDRERLKQICDPEERFGANAQQTVHKEDILCIAKSKGDLIATGDYGGTTIVWNMSSKKMFATLKSIDESKISPDENPNDRVVSRVLFIEERYNLRDGANLITSGPRGHIHFWNIYKNGVLIAKFRPNKDRRTTVTQIKLDESSYTLFAADSLGFLFIYDIEKYGFRQESEPPECLRMWRGHVDSVTGLQFIKQTQVLITSSLDWTIRLWNLSGHFIGTFGQAIPWNLYDPATFQHPAVPLDVLTDPKSLPVHEIKLDEQSPKEKAAAPIINIVPHKQPMIDDETIASNVRDTIDKLRQSESDFLPGKRLRYFREKPVVVPRRDGSSHYQNLRFYPVDDNPPTTNSNNIHFSNTVK